MADQGNGSLGEWWRTLIVVLPLLTVGLGVVQFYTRAIIREEIEPLHTRLTTLEAELDKNNLEIERGAEERHAVCLHIVGHMDELRKQAFQHALPDNICAALK